MFSKLPIASKFEISLQNLPIIQDWLEFKMHSFYSEAGSDLFIECPFHSTQ
jgi:hypothetical protein